REFALPGAVGPRRRILMRWRATACLLALLAGGRPAWAQPEGPGPRAPVPGHRPPASRMANGPEVPRRLGLVPDYEGIAGIEAVKGAVLDYGFGGIRDRRAYTPGGA